MRAVGGKICGAWRVGEEEGAAVVRIRAMVHQGHAWPIIFPPLGGGCRKINGNGVPTLKDSVSQSLSQHNLSEVGSNLTSALFKKYYKRMKTEREAQLRRGTNLIWSACCFCC